MQKKRLLVVLVIALFALTNVGAGYGDKVEFFTVLTGGQEVPPVETDARGGAVIEVYGDGAALYFKVVVANIENVVAAHIHQAPVGANGPVIITLCGAPGPAPACKNLPGSNFVAIGTVTQTNSGESLANLIAQMKAGNTYVNVHTPQNPSGEVRGQIVLRHH